jgi:hypothetical protein
MANILLDFLKEIGLDINNCRGQSYDNASNMLGRYNGVQAIVKQKCKYAAFISSCNHSLNLIGDQAVGSCVGCTKFFDFVNGLYVFLSGSTYCWQLLKDHCTLTLKGLPGTRWCERADAVKALVQEWKGIQEVLDELAVDQEQNADTRNQADGFSRRMDEIETAIMATAWNDILGWLNSTSIRLQDPTVSLNTATGLMASLVATVQLFGFLSELTALTNEQIENKALNLVSTYPGDLEITLVAEMIQFAAFVRNQNLQKPVNEKLNESPELTMYKLLRSLNLSATFPNVEISLRIYLCMMVSNASGERSFSKLGIVKGDLRSSMGQERLSMLALMSIEHDVLRSIDFTDTIEEFAIAKARKTAI